MKIKIFDIQLSNGCGDDVFVSVAHEDEQAAIEIAKEFSDNPKYAHAYLNCQEVAKVKSRLVEVTNGTIISSDFCDHECGIHLQSDSGAFPLEKNHE